MKDYHHITCFFLLRHFYMEAISSTQMMRFFNRCLPIEFSPETMFVHTCDREFFPPNCCKFAAECDDWNSTISQIVYKLGFFGKIDGFGKKPWIFSKSLIVKFFCRIRPKLYYFWRMSFQIICEIFLAKNQKIF